MILSFLKTLLIPWKWLHPVVRWIILIPAILFMAFFLEHQLYTKNAYKWTPLSEEIQEYRMPLDDTGGYALFQAKEKRGWSIAPSSSTSGSMFRFHVFYPSFVGDGILTTYDPKYKDEISLMINIHYQGAFAQTEEGKKQRLELPEPKIFDCHDTTKGSYDIFFYYKEFYIEIVIPNRRECELTSEQHHDIIQRIQKFIDEEFFKGVVYPNPSKANS